MGNETTVPIGNSPRRAIQSEDAIQLSGLKKGSFDFNYKTFE